MDYTMPAFFHPFENFGIIKKYSQPPTTIKTKESNVTFDERVQFKIILEDHNYDSNYFIPYP